MYTHISITGASFEQKEVIELKRVFGLDKKVKEQQLPGKKSIQFTLHVRLPAVLRAHLEDMIVGNSLDYQPVSTTS